MNQLKAVLLDLDGTLIDTNDMHARAWLDALPEFGYRASFAEVRGMIGMGTDNLIPRLLGLAKDDPRLEKMGEREAEIFREKYLPDAEPFPQTRELLKRMSRAGLTLVAASSSQRENAKLLLKKIGVEDLLDGTTTSSDADRSKPHPDIVQAALDKADCPPDQAIMLGDSPYDVEAAERAGVRTIALRCGGFSEESLHGASAIYDDPADLLARYDESPLAKHA